MAAYDALAAAVLALRAHALNCGMDKDEPDPAAWATRRATLWLSLIAPAEQPACPGRSLSINPYRRTAMISPEPASFVGETPVSSDLQPPVTHDLILASRITGTPVYNRGGEHMGHISDLSIDKVSGRALYGLLSIGGFLGLGEKLHPIPWGALDYDPALAGYVVRFTKEELKAAPSLTPPELEGLGAGDGWRVRLDDYYATSPVI